MELFANFLEPGWFFVYRCFDRIVLSGYLMGLLPARPGCLHGCSRTLGIEARSQRKFSASTREYTRYELLRPESGGFRWNGP